MSQYDKKYDDVYYIFFIFLLSSSSHHILLLLGGASQTGCYREGQCSAGPGVSPQRTPHTV